jgi:hypothetical protein
MTLTIVPLPSPNYSERSVSSPFAIVIHTGEGTRTGDLNTLRNNSVPLANRVSSNYYVCRDGTICQLVDDRHEAWHAGWCNYLGYTDWNGISLGIETEHRTGVDDWPSVQKDALAALCSAKIGQYHIKREMVVTHRWIAVPPGRKSDPGNWPDAEFRDWVDRLYLPATWDGPAGTFPVDPKLQAYYDRSGGLWARDKYCLGWAISPLTGGVQKFERGALRLRSDGGIDALLRQEW